MNNPLSTEVISRPQPVIPGKAGRGSSSCGCSGESSSTGSSSGGGNIVGTNVVTGRIPFTLTGGPLQILNYNTIYKPIYGNDLITLQVFLTGFTEADQTPAEITYANPSDPSTDIISILWDFNPDTALSGYIKIAGVLPLTGTGGGSGGGQGYQPFPFSDTNLVDDGDGGFYLPLNGIPTTKRPNFVESNEVQVVGLRYDGTYTPARIYGFGNNDSPQVITVFA